MPSFFQDPTLDMTPAEQERAKTAALNRLAGQHHPPQNNKKNNNKYGGVGNGSGGGPRTPEGKAISSQNARKHGFASANPVIASIEDQDAWEAHLSSYFDTFLPVSQPECDTVRRAALAMWKIDRISAVEAALFSLEFEHHLPMADARLSPTLPAIHRMAVAFKESAGDRAFDLCRRYLHSVTREHDHAIRTFYLLQSNRVTGMGSATAGALAGTASGTGAGPEIIATPTGASAAPPQESASPVVETPVYAPQHAAENSREPNELPLSAPLLSFVPKPAASAPPATPKQPKKMA